MRKEDPTNATFFRSGDRLFSQNGQWFYQTREEDRGPFPNREAALADLQRYVNEKALFEAIPYERAGLKPRPATPGRSDFSLLDDADS